MANIGNLAIRLSANATAFTQGIQAASKTVADFANDAGSALSRLGSGGISGLFGASSGITALIPGLGGVSSAIQSAGSAFAGLIQSGFSAAKEQDGLSRQLGVSSSAAAGFQSAAALAGKSVQEATPGLIYMRRQLALAGTGSGEAASAFSRLGLNAAELARSPMEDALSQINDRLQAVDGASRALAVRSIFGRHGEEAAALIRRLDEGRRLAADFGTALNDADKTGIKSASEDLNRAGASFSALRQSFTTNIAAAVAPAVSAVSGIFADALKLARPLVGVVRSIAGFVGNVVTGIANVIRPVVAALSPFVDVIGSLLNVVGGIVSGIGEVFGGILGTIGSVIGTILSPIADFLRVLTGGTTFATEQGTRQLADLSGTARQREAAARQRQIDREREQVRTSQEETTGPAFDIGTLTRRSLASQRGDMLAEELQRQQAAAQERDAERARGLNAGEMAAALADARTGIVQNTQALRDQATTLGMSTDAAARFTAVQALMRNTGMDEVRANAELAVSLRQQAQARGEVWAAQQQQNLGNTLQQTASSLREQIAVMGMSADQSAIWRLQQQGANDEQLRGIRLQQEHLQWFRARQAAEQAANSTMQQVRNPVERAQDRLNDLQEQLQNGGLSWESYGRAVSLVADELERASGAGDQGGPAGLSQGSREAISALNRARRQQGNSNDPATRIERAVDRLRPFLERQDRNAEAVRRAWENGEFFELVEW